MDENENKVLDVAETSANTPEAPKEETSNNSAEKTLITIANIVLICGLIATFFCFWNTVFVQDRTYVDKDELSPKGVAFTVVVLLCTLVTWALLKVTANISLTLKEMNKKMK